jgi:hypothetical protein
VMACLSQSGLPEVGDDDYTWSLVRFDCV